MKLRAKISEQLLALEARISPSNKLGDIDGLFAHFILEGAHICKWTWEVNCADTTWVQDHASGLTRGNPNLLSALGYSLAIAQPLKQDEWFNTFAKGMKVLQKRDLFPIDGVSFPNIPRIFLGLALGAKAIPDANKRDAMCEWLLDVLNQVASRKATSSIGLAYTCIRSLLVNEPQRVERRNFTHISDMAFLEWGINKHIFEVRDSSKEISEFREHLVAEILSTDAQQLDSAQAALLWYGLNNCLTVSVHELMVSPSHVSAILSRFQDGMRRWRWDSEQVKHPIQWVIREEREIQDIIWIMLKPVFPDLVDEDTLPKLGHSSYKADFGIPSLGLLIEVKMARKAEDFKGIEKEIMEDSRGYLTQTDRYNRILVFIYDDSASVQEHGITKQALEKLPEIEHVIIVSRPSHLPLSTSL
jgi:hypothetical protein